MGAVAVVFVAILLCLSIFLQKTKYRFTSPLILFLFLWTNILFLSTLNLFGLEPASDMSYILLLVMVASFTLGYCIHSCIKNKNYSKNSTKEETTNKQAINLPSLRDSFILKLLFTIIIITIVLNLIDYFIGLRYILQGLKPWQIRNWTLEPYGSSNPILDRRSFIEEVFRAFIASPVEMLLPPIAAFYCFVSKKKKTRRAILALSIANLVSSSLAGGGGRIGFIYYLGCFIVAYFALKRSKFLRSNINTRRIAIAAILCVLAIVALTVFRTNINSIVKQAYIYFALPPSLLTKWLPSIGATGLTFGLTTLFGFHSPFFRVLKILGLEAFVPGVYSLSEMNVFNAESYMKMGSSAYNAFVTPIYYYMSDGGIIAVILFSFLFGLICSCIYQHFLKNMTIRSFVLYALMFYGVFLSFSRIQTVSPAYILAFVFALIFIRRKKNARR